MPKGTVSGFNGEVLGIVPTLLDDGVDLSNYKKVPLLDLAALGIGFNSIYTSIKNPAEAATGGSGIYHVEVPPGKVMMHFKDEPAFLGSIAAENGGVGGGQARITPLDPPTFDPTMVFMAVVMMNIQHKLNIIQETQEEILQFLEQKEKAELRGNIIFMAGIIDDYKYNWNNQQVINNWHVSILEIKREAEQKMLFAQNRIKTVAAKKKLIKISPNVKAQIKKLNKAFEDYQLAAYTYAMASYVEIMLTKNFEKIYVNSIAQKIENYSIEYRELYTDCYDILSENYDKSLDTILIDGVAKATKTAGSAVAKIPVIGEHTQIDDNLIAIGEIIDDSDDAIKLGKLSDITAKQRSYIEPFVENIRVIGELYERPTTILLDEEYAYFEPISA